jgi:GntR family transcriptional regulator, transcriptional repressor for pyruvate dehydrogenase complex
LSDNLTFSPISRRKTYELVADRLLALMASRRLSPGDAVPPERELVETYQVGRSSVREALRMLESQGLIEACGTGAFVVTHARNSLNQSFELLLSVDEADLHELFEVRRFLEGECAALAAGRRRDDDLAAMGEAIAEMEGGLESEETYIAADLRFHLTVAEATGNRVFAHLMHAIRDQLRQALGTVYQIPHSAERSLTQHREIAEAIRLRRPDDARARMHEHIGRVEQEIHTLERR